MKKLYIVGTLLFTTFIMLGQCPTTTIDITTQAEIDNFTSTYPNCTMLTHELNISGETNSITNLDGLSNIIEADYIFIRQTDISNFNGLHNLENISHLALWGNNNLQDLEGLTALQTIGDIEIWINNGMTNLEGMDNIQSIGRLNIFGNSSLADISQLNFLTSLTSLVVGGNALNSLTGLENLQTIVEDLSISNESVQDFNELSNLQNIGGSLYILENDQVQDITAFDNINSVADLYVIGCPNLAVLSGLENIESVTGRLRIGFNAELTDLSVFSNITSVYDLDIYENQNLQTLDGLEGLLEIDGRLLIMDNPILDNIESIANVNPFIIDELVLINNQSLGVCDNKLVCAVVDDPSIPEVITNNTTGCNSVPEVQAICDSLSVEDFILDTLISVYPNPASDVIFISTSEGIHFENATVYSMLGEQLLTTSEETITIAHLSQGVYFIEISTDVGKASKKIIKK